MLRIVVITGFEAMPPAGGDTIVVVGMDDATPAKLILFIGSIELFGRTAEERQGTWANVGEPPGGVRRPREAGHALKNLQRTHFIGDGFGR
jgi:hypothetical protein